jgi:hypothetical protein
MQPVAGEQGVLALSDQAAQCETLSAPTRISLVTLGKFLGAQARGLQKLSRFNTAIIDGNGALDFAP